MQDQTTEPTEADRVEAWRTGILLDAGYPPSIAVEFACRPDIDVRHAARLTENGCPVPVAVSILR